MVSPVTMATPAASAAAGHGGHDALQVGDGEALLEDEPGRQVQRPGPGHGQVVDRAVDGEVADVAAGEEQRRHHVGVGGEGQAGPPTVKTAWSSSGSSSGLRKASRKMASIRVWVALPPAPCARVMRSSLTRALRCRALARCGPGPAVPWSGAPGRPGTGPARDPETASSTASSAQPARCSVSRSAGHARMASATRSRVKRPKL